MRYAIVGYLILTSIILSCSTVHSLDNQIEEKWSIEFGKYFKGGKRQGIESFGIDDKQNILLQISTSIAVCFAKYDIYGNEVICVPMPYEDFSTNPIMDKYGNIYTYMPWAENEYNCTYMKFDTNMSFLREIEIDSPLAHQCKISNQGNIYLVVGKGFSIDDVKYTNTTIHSFNQSGYLDWNLTFTTKHTMNRTRTSPFLDWKIKETNEGDLFMGFLDNLIRINTHNKSVVWQRKLSQEIYSVSTRKDGVRVMTTNYVTGPIINTLISFDNTIISSFIMETKPLCDYYFSSSFNGEFFFIKTTGHGDKSICKLRILTESGTQLYVARYAENSNVFKLYGLRTSLTDFYTLETYYNSSNYKTTYYLKRNSFKNISQRRFFIISVSILQLIVIELVVIIRFKQVKSRKIREITV